MSGHEYCKNILRLCSHYFAPNRIPFHLARKPYRIGLLFTYKNGYGGAISVTVRRGRSRIFFRRGCTRLLLYFNTNKPHSFFLQNTSCIRKPQVISGRGGGAHPLHPPPRSAPGAKLRRADLCLVTGRKFACKGRLERENGRYVLYV